MYVVGDLHGDLDQARCALEMAGVLSSDGQDLWMGGETVCVYLHMQNSLLISFLWESI